MMLRSCLRLVRWTSGMVVAACAAAASQAPPRAGDSDPAAISLRDRLEQTYRGLRSLREEVTQRQWTGNEQEASTIEMELRFQRPNRLFLRMDYPIVTGPGRWQRVIACDGKTVTLYNSLRNEVTRLRAPATLSGLILPSAYRGPELALALQGADPFREVEHTATARYTASFQEGPEGRANVLQLATEEQDQKAGARYYLDPATLLLRRIELDVTPRAEANSPFLVLQGASHVRVEYRQVEANLRLAAAEFVFQPPVDAKLVPAVHTK